MAGMPRRRATPAASLAGIHLTLIALSALFIVPLLLMLSTALKESSQVVSVTPQLIPHPFVWHNFVAAVDAIPFARYFRNTLIIAGLNVIGVTASSSLVAYGFSRIRWPGRDVVFVFVIATMIMPTQVTLIPLYIVFRNLGWVNTFYPLVVPAFFGDAFSIFLLRQFFMSLPIELNEAAEMDGASEITTFVRCILPLTKPALMTVALFQFLYSWNDFLGPLIYLNSTRLYTLSLGLESYMGAHFTEWTLLMAASTIITLPIVVLFFFTQRTFVRGISFGGLRG
jgi:multiple sugar transport system permease protein